MPRTREPGLLVVVFVTLERHIEVDLPVRPEVLPDMGEAKPLVHVPGSVIGRRHVPAKDVANRLIGNLVLQIGHRADDSVVTPAWILPRHPNNQFDDGVSDRTRPWIRPAR